MSDTETVFPSLANKVKTIPGKVCISAKTGWDIVDINTILALEANGSYLVMHLTSGEQITVCKTIGTFLESLSAAHPLVRVHKSYAVNANYIVWIPKGRKGKIKLKYGLQIPVSPMYWEGIVALFALSQ